MQNANQVNHRLIFTKSVLEDNFYLFQGGLSDVQSAQEADCLCVVLLYGLLHLLVVLVKLLQQRGIYTCTQRSLVVPIHVCMHGHTLFVMFASIVLRQASASTENHRAKSE